MSSVPGPSRADVLWVEELRRRVAWCRLVQTNGRLFGAHSAQQECLLSHAAFSHYRSLLALGLVAEGRRLIGIAS